MQVNDAMVAKALDAFTECKSSNDLDAMNAALTAALAEMWRTDFESAPTMEPVALAELTPVRDMLVLCGELGGIQPGEGMSGYLRRLIDEVAGKECERAFIAEHGSDSREVES